MSEYRIRESGDIKSQGEIRKLHSNTSIPKIWDSNVCDDLEIDPVFITPKPAPSGAYKVVVRNGAEKDAKDNWVQAWVEKDMFLEYTDDENVTHTKAAQETEYQAKSDAQSSADVRQERDELLAKTDWLALSDTTMSSEWTTYRQALRDVTAQAGFPGTITWPTEPGG